MHGFAPGSAAGIEHSFPRLRVEEGDGDPGVDILNPEQPGAKGRGGEQALGFPDPEAAFEILNRLRVESALGQLRRKAAAATRVDPGEQGRLAVVCLQQGFCSGVPPAFQPTLHQPAGMGMGKGEVPCRIPVPVGKRQRHRFGGSPAQHRVDQSRQVSPAAAPGQGYGGVHCSPGRHAIEPQQLEKAHPEKVANIPGQPFYRFPGELVRAPVEPGPPLDDPVDQLPGEAAVAAVEVGGGGLEDLVQGSLSGVEVAQGGKSRGARAKACPGGVGPLNHGKTGSMERGLTAKRRRERFKRKQPGGPDRIYT